MKSLNRCARLYFTGAVLLAATAATGDQQPAAVDLLIRGGTIVTMDADRRVIRNGSIAISGGHVEAIYTEAEQVPEAARTIDGAGHLVIPGLINTHGHTAMTLLRGFADDLTLLDWLNDHVFPAESLHVDPEFVYWGTLLGGVEMALAGTTTFADMYYFEDSAARATAEVGLRGVLAGTIVGFEAPDYRSPEAALDAASEFLREWEDHPLVSPSVSVQSLYTTSLEIVVAASELARDHGALFQIHAVEPPEENDLVLERIGRRTIPALSEAGVLGPGTLLHHGIWLSDDDIELIAASAASISHNPESNMKTASGVAPVPDLLRAGVVVGLGTDGAASNNNLDLFEEMDTAAKLHKLIQRDPTVLPAEVVFEMATMGGARALGMHDRIGSLEVGKLADLVLVRMGTPELTPLYDVYSQLVYAAKGSDVTTVVVNGRVVVDSGSVVTVDARAVMARANEIRDQVASSLGVGAR